MIEKHNHYTVIAYRGMSKGEKIYLGSTEVFVFSAQNVDDAIEQAKSLVKANHYHIVRITECFTDHNPTETLVAGMKGIHDN